ncbi:MAG TPA: condensation domain-containing protein [Stellaceae bacterium]|nr:condensation domain-containing protein [Stellaceae bacterium]
MLARSADEPSPKTMEAAGRFTLTAPQLSIWLDQALHPHKPIYNTGQTLGINTSLNLDHFMSALRRVVTENDALRLRFHKGTEILQETVDAAEIDADFRDFSAAADAETAASGWIDRLFWEPFEPTDFPLFRFAVAKLSDERFVWMQKYHHLVIDATGRQIVASRVAAIYDALRQDREIPPSENASYRVARSLEDEYLSSEQYALDRKYWAKRLSGLPGPLVGIGPSRSEKLRSGRPTRLDCGLSEREAAGLHAVARRYQSSAFKVILAITWMCCCRVYAKEDLVVGVPVAHRMTPLSKRCVGLFSKVMPFRMSLDPEMTLAAALREINLALSEDLRHQSFPTDHISREIRHHGSLFDIGVNYVRSNYGFTLDGAPVACTNLSAGFSVPLAVVVFEDAADGSLLILLEYDQGRVTALEAEHFVRCFRSILSGILASGSAMDAMSAMMAEVPVAAAAMPVPPSAPLAERAPSSAPVIASTSSIPETIRTGVLDMWCTLFKGINVGWDDDYFQLGGDSLKAIWMIGECNERFGIDLPLGVLFEHPTPVGFAQAVAAAARSDTRSLLAVLKEGSAPAPLLLVHPVGGTLFCYRDLVSRLPETLKVYGLRASGVWPGEPLADSIEEMARGYVELATAATGRVACHLAGWSFGGLVAFEMARQFAADGMPPASLTLIDTPSYPHLLGEQVDDALFAVAEALRVEPSAITAPAETPLTAAIIAELAPPELPKPSEDQLECMVAMVRNVRRMRNRYQLGRFAGSVTLFRASADTAVDHPAFDWRNAVAGPLQICSLPASHRTIMLPPFVEQVARHLSREVRRPT